MPETATRLGEKLSLKELGRDYKAVLKNGRFVAGALATGFVSLPLLAWIAQSPVIIISGEQLSSYEYGLLQVPIFGALIIGNLVLARLTSRRTVRSLIIMGGWPDCGRADYRGGGDGGLVPCVSVDDGGVEHSTRLVLAWRMPAWYA